MEFRWGVVLACAAKSARQRLRRGRSFGWFAENAATTFAQTSPLLAHVRRDRNQEASRGREASSTVSTGASPRAALKARGHQIYLTTVARSSSVAWRRGRPDSNGHLRDTTPHALSSWAVTSTHGVPGRWGTSAPR